MKKLFMVSLSAVLLSGCAAHQAGMSYAAATNAYNKCLLANPDAPATCAAQAAVMQNDLALYNNLSE